MNTILECCPCINLLSVGHWCWWDRVTDKIAWSELAVPNLWSESRIYTQNVPSCFVPFLHPFFSACILAIMIRSSDIPFLNQTYWPWGVARNGGKFNILGTGWGVVLTLMPESRKSDKTVSRMSVGSHVKATSAGQAFHHSRLTRTPRKNTLRRHPENSALK